MYSHPPNTSRTILPMLKKMITGALLITMVGVYAYMALIMLMFLI